MDIWDTFLLLDRSLPPRELRGVRLDILEDLEAVSSPACECARLVSLGEFEGVSSKLNEFARLKLPVLVDVGGVFCDPRRFVGIKVAGIECLGVLSFLDFEERPLADTIRRLLGDD